jgi:hypothetical protein
MTSRMTDGIGLRPEIKLNVRQPTVEPKRQISLNCYGTSGFAALQQIFNTMYLNNGPITHIGDMIPCALTASVLSLFARFSPRRLPLPPPQLSLKRHMTGFGA